MTRLGRYFLEDQPLHVIQRGDNRSAIFFCDDDYVRYLGWPAVTAAGYGCAIHAYGLMTNHVHLLVTPATAESVPRMMQSLEPAVRASRQRHLSTHRHGLERPISRGTDRQRGLFPRLLPLHRLVFPCRLS
jgi:REP element-mobilizing transposase RayT